jgi:hypothetical protein
VKLIRYWHRLAIVLTGLAVSLAGLAGVAVLAGAASAATGVLPPPELDGGAAAAAAVQPVVVGGMPGWQIALIAVGAALAAAAIAVPVDRARRGRLRLAGEAA